MKHSGVVSSCKQKVSDNTLLEKNLADGYLEMSHINLSLAEEAIDCDNEALALCEQNLRSVNECDC